MGTNEKDHAAREHERLSSDDDDNVPDPALDSARDPGPHKVVKSTSGLMSIEEAPKPPDPRDEHEYDEHHGLAHTTPVSLLVVVLAALLVLTIITVGVTKVDLGSQGNLVIAMVIATIKAALVVMYFMHLRWDRKVHLVIFLGSVLFVILFLSMTITDRGEYQRSIDDLEEVQAATK
ncbi:MAG TPA: cytochrome C oxidase subunit IV family protein [Polyangiaceae bacterium]|nr:cytochrome C oxidase subunit IV family protein [Polyangiaceae bacterium]